MGTPSRIIVGALLLGLFAGEVTAQDGAAGDQGAQDTRIGYASTGLPGYGRVILPRPTPWLVGIAGSAGYGLTPEVLGLGDSHNRISGRLGLSLAPIDWLQIALNFDGRFDMHSLGDGTTDDGLVGDPRLFIRAGGDLGGLFVGGEVVLWLPGANAPSIEFSATTVDLKAAGGIMINPDFSLALNAGFRIDNSANAVENQGNDLSESDRMSLGLSEWNALLLGFGGAYRFGPAELWAEWSWDLLLGDGAPDAGASPMRVDLGGRFWVDDAGAVQLHAGVGFLVSSYPDRDMATGRLPLMPIEPRFHVDLGATFRFPTPDQGGAVEEEEEEEEQVEEVVAAGVIVRGRVVDAGGQPVVGATVTVSPGEGDALDPVTTDSDGAFTFRDVPSAPGAIVTIAAEGYHEYTEALDLSTGDTVAVRVPLERDLPSGQLRGVVQSFRGEPVAATITVSPGNHGITANEDGSFELDLEPGDYEVVIQAEGFTQQTRPVHIEERGVTIVNIDLRSGRRGRGRRR